MMRIGLLVALITALVLLSGCGSSARVGHPAAAPQHAATPQHLQGLVLTAPHTAPQFSLRDYTGQPVTLSGLRGRAVFLTFIYTHCPDVCPLIASGLAAAQRQLGKLASRVRMVAVTVDPVGDTASAVRQFLAARDATGRITYLIGSRRELLPVWRAYGVAVTLNPRKVVEGGHTAIVFGITPEGKIVVVYPGNFTPSQIVHDAPLLVGS